MVGSARVTSVLLGVAVLVLAAVAVVSFIPFSAHAQLGSDIFCQVSDDLNQHLPSFPAGGCDEGEEAPPTCDEGEVLEGNVCVPEEADDGETTPPADTVGSSSSSSGGGGGHSRRSGEVLGDSTEVCSTPLITTYLGLGKPNDTADTVKLHVFLNKELGLSLPASGIFSAETKAAVEQFQLKYADEVLAPWVPFGLASAATPTGYVYKTTKRMVNKIYCASLEIPMPQLP